MHRDAFLTGKAYEREEVGSEGRTIWFEAEVLGRKVKVKAMAQAGDAGEPVMTLQLAQEGESSAKG